MAESRLEENLERLMKAAVAGDAPGMSAEQVRQVCERAVTGACRPVVFPLWAIAASAACLGGLAALALSAAPEAPVRIMAVAALAGNLVLSPLAALVLVGSRRRSHAS